MKQQKLLFQPLELVDAPTTRTKEEEEEEASRRRHRPPNSSSNAVVDNKQDDESDESSDDEDWNISLSALAATTRKRPLQDSSSNQNSRSCAKKQAKQSPGGVATNPETSKVLLRPDRRPTKIPPQQQQRQQGQTPKEQERRMSDTENNAESRGVVNPPETESSSKIDDCDHPTVPAFSSDASTTKNEENDKTKQNPSHLDKATKQKAVRRRLSSVSMDYIDPDLDLNLSKKLQRVNIVQQLYRREIHPSSFNIFKSNGRPNTSASLVTPPFRQFKAPTYMEIASIRSRPGTTDAGVLQLKWDSMGVLLAAAGAKAIYIFDWDMVHSIDLKGRSERARFKSRNNNYPRQHWSVPPILSFVCPQYVSCVEWNSFDMDLLAVGFRGSGAVHIYNVNHVSSWLSKQQNRNQFTPPPSFTHQTLVHTRCTGTVSCLLFVGKYTVVISMGCNTFCWKFPPMDSLQLKHKPVLKWRYRSSDNITCMEKLGSDTLVLGSDRGRFIFIPFEKSVKGALSSDPKPIVLRELFPHTKLREFPNDGNMGILKMSLDKTAQSESSKMSVTNSKFTRLTLRWVTRGGWLLSTTLTLPLHKSDKLFQEECTIHHEPPRVKVVNAEGEPLQISKVSWSAPIEAMAADSAPGFCFSDVPSVTRVLPHHNKYVLTDSQKTTVTHSKSRGLLWKDFSHGDAESSSAPSFVPLPKGCRRLPQTIAVHPSREWIIAGFPDGQVVAMASRM